MQALPKAWPQFEVRALMNLKREQELCLDGIETSFTMMRIAYERLCQAVLQHSQATSQGDSTSDIQKSILLDAWSLIDITNRLRVLVKRTPGLKHSAPFKSFLTATKDVETLRHFVQHLDGEVVGLAETGWPIWGSLSWLWASPEMQKRGEVNVVIIVPGRLAPCKDYHMVNPAGKRIHGPVDHICLSAADTTVNLSEIVRSSMLFRDRFQAALERAKEIQIEQSNGERVVILEIALDIEKMDEVSD